MSVDSNGKGFELLKMMLEEHSSRLGETLRHIEALYRMVNQNVNRLTEQRALVTKIETTLDSQRREIKQIAALSDERAKSVIKNMWAVGGLLVVTLLGAILGVAFMGAAK